MGKGLRARIRAALRHDVTDDRRGVALLMVLTAIAVLAAFSVEFSYNMRVSVNLAANLRREVQAYYNARSAVEIARATILAEKRFKQMLGPMARTQHIELWRYACKFAEMFNTGKVSFLGQDLVDLNDFEGIGATEGDFSCEVIPEDGKINVGRVGNAGDKTALFRRAYAVLRRYFGVESMDTRDREAVELILNIIDWSDADEARSDIDEAGNVVDSGGAEGGAGGYSRYGYEARNAKFDTNEELRLVEGMTDQLYCDLGQQMTVYDTEKLNINTADIEVIKALICEYVQGDMLAVCGLTAAGGASFGMLTPVDLVGQIIETCRTLRGQFMMPGFSNTQAFVQLLTRLPDPLNKMVRVNAAQLQKEIGVDARVVRIRARGQSGRVEKRLEAVLDTGGAKYVYWREL